MLKAEEEKKNKSLYANICVDFSGILSLEFASMEHPMGKLLIKLKDFKKKPPWHLYRTSQRLC